jgi:hypothetical protein
MPAQPVINRLRGHPARHLKGHQLNARRLSAAALVAAVVVPLTAGHATAASVNKAEAKTLVRAGVLTAKDFPGYTAEPVPFDPDGAALEKAFYRCTGVKAPSYVKRDLGTSFSKGNREYDSAANVARSASAALAHFRAYRSAKAVACRQKVARQSAKDDGVTVVSLRAHSVSVQVSGADAAVGRRVRGKYYFHRTVFTFEGYEIDGVVGAVEFQLASVGYDGTAPSLHKLESAARTVVKRVRAG